MVSREIEDAFANAGLTLEQAREIANAFESRIQRVVTEATEDLATKEELRALRQEFFAWRGEMVEQLRRHEAEIGAQFAEHREQVRKEIGDQRRDFDQLRVEFAELRVEFAELRVEVAELRTRIEGLEAKIDDQIEFQRRIMIAGLSLIGVLVVGLLSVVIAVVV